MSSPDFNVTSAQILRAKAELSRYLQPSPLLLNPWLSEAFGCELFLKMENMQPIGSFKARGATYKIASLSAEQRKTGVIAASQGNHAQGVAWGSRKVGTSALIVMPKSAPIVKIHNTQSLGAQIQLEGESLEEAIVAAKSIAEQSGRTFIHAFEDEKVIAGQGTVGFEILEQCPEVDLIVCPIGGGGLLAGLSIAIKDAMPKVQIVGCQATGAASMIESIEKGTAQKLAKVDTFADGIRIAAASEKLRALLAPRVDRLLKADDEEMAAAILMLLEKAKVLAEASGALPLAVLEQMRAEIKGKKVVLVISGGNIDVNVLARVLDRGLIRAGRRLRANVLISDRPGSLNKLTALLAALGVSILQAIHDRNEPSTKIDQTEVELTLETRGPDHSAEVIQALKENVLRLVMMNA